MENKATLLKATGEVIEIAPANGKRFTLDELYRHIETDIVEILPMGEEAHQGMMMIGDEESRLRSDYIVNEKATAIWRETFGITDPHKAWAEHVRNVESMGGIICAPDLREGEEPFNVVGNIVFCPESMMEDDD